MQEDIVNWNSTLLTTVSQSCCAKGFTLKREDTVVRGVSRSKSGTKTAEHGESVREGPTTTVKLADGV